jgi:hypothetical protein
LALSPFSVSLFEKNLLEIPEVDFTSVPLKIRTDSSSVDDNVDSTGDNLFLTESL